MHGPLIVLLSLLGLLVFAAPAGAMDYWTNYPEPAPTSQEFAQIQAECRHDEAVTGIGAAQAYNQLRSGEYAGTRAEMIAAAKDQAYTACMQARGFRKVPERDADRIRALRQQQQSQQPPQSGTLPTHPPARYEGD